MTYTAQSGLLKLPKYIKMMKLFQYCSGVLFFRTDQNKLRLHLCAVNTVVLQDFHAASAVNQIVAVFIMVQTILKVNSSLLHRSPW